MCTKDGYAIQSETVYTNYVSKSWVNEQEFLIDEINEKTIAVPSTSTTPTVSVIAPVSF